MAKDLRSTQENESPVTNTIFEEISQPSIESQDDLKHFFGSMFRNCNFSVDEDDIPVVG